MRLLLQMSKRSWVSASSLLNSIPSRKPVVRSQPPTVRCMAEQLSVCSSNIGATVFFSTRPAFTENPYTVLKIPVTSNFERVQKTFLRLALEHHPDKTGQSDSVEKFIRIRQAFEIIRAEATGKDKVGTDSTLNDKELQSWLYEETGEFLSFQMDYSTRQEVIKAYATLAPGGRDPGEWELARQLTERANMKDDDEDDGPLKQLGGPVQVGSMRRRRRR